MSTPGLPVAMKMLCFPLFTINRSKAVELSRSFSELPAFRCRPFTIKSNKQKTEDFLQQTGCSTRLYGFFRVADGIFVLTKRRI